MKKVKLPCTKKPCKDCPFRKDTLKGWLGRERMTAILQADRFVCHKKTDLQCAGHMLLRGNNNLFVRYAAALKLNTCVKGRALVFDTEQACIDHHS